MSSVRNLPGTFIPGADDVLTDGMGQHWVPSGWPVLLRDTPEDRERLARRLHDQFHSPPWGSHEFGAGCADGERDADGWRRKADAIIAALRAVK